MNHFAHLVLAKPTIESVVGNLLGDFARGVDMAQLDPAIRAGLENHRLVDRFTDNHPLIQDLKKRFSSRRRRFAGIALDIYFDHLLINHWSSFEQRPLQPLIENIYQQMEAGREIMPAENMRLVTQRMIETDWFGSYRHLDSIAESLDRVAARIRFNNRFDNAIEELLDHGDAIEKAFIEFYPQLQRQVIQQALETD